jgi:hypothetical protein
VRNTISIVACKHLLLFLSNKCNIKVNQSVVNGRFQEQGNCEKSWFKQGKMKRNADLVWNSGEISGPYFANTRISDIISKWQRI